MERVSFDIGGKVFKVDPQMSAATDELFYIVTAPEGEQFTMAYDNDMHRLAVDRPAPYIAIEYEIELADLIQAYNDDML